MNLRHLVRIATWESKKSAGTIDRRTAVAIVFMILAVGLVFPTMTGGGVLDAGIYTVGVEEDHEYVPAIEEEPALQAVDPGANADVYVQDTIVHGTVVHPGDDSDKSQAAISELREAIERYNLRQLGQEEDQAAAFPVVVSLEYESRDGSPLVPDDIVEDDDPTVEDDEGEPDEPADDEPVADDEEPAADDEDGVAEPGFQPPEDGDVTDLPDADDDRIAVPGIGGPATGIEGITDTPSNLSPPFPFGSLLLAFLFVIPMNFVIQAYGSTIMDERIKRRGELLLVSPVSRFDIVGGKTLPYLGVLLGITAALALVVGGGILSIAAVLPIALLFLASTFVGAMFARSYKELTFVTVTITVVLTTYVFVPAIFTDVTPIALISPLTLVVFDLQGIGTSIPVYLFSTGPFYLASAVLFALGLGIYREEDMFTQRPVHLKALDALAAYVYSARHVGIVSALLIPFVFVAQLLAVAMLFILPLSISLPILLVVISIVEELAKSIHVLAGYSHDRFDRSIGTAVVLGAASGTGFFVAEKITHATQIVGLHELELGRIAFAAETGVTPVLAVGLFLAPLFLHAVTATLSALGARKGTTPYVIGLAGAILVHTLYNYGVITLVS